MRRLLILVVWLVISVVPLHAGADDDNGTGAWRHDEDRVLKLFDAQGKLIGRLASYAGYDGVFLTINGTIVFAQIGYANTNFEVYQSAKYQWLESFPAAYTNPSCSGLPVIPPGLSPRPAFSVRTGTDVTLYIAGDSDSAAVTPVASFDGTTCSPLSGTPTPDPFFAAETSYSLTVHYPEPLTISY